MTVCVEYLGVADLRHALAYEEAIFIEAQSVEPGHACVLYWSPRPAISIGRMQGYCEEVWCRSAGAAGVPIVRRHTGGGAVFLDEGCIAFSIIGSGGPRWPLEVYRLGGAVIVEALRGEGLEASIENLNDVVVNGWKVAGSAARVGPRGWVFHAVVLVHSDMRLMRFLKPPLWRVARGEVTASKYKPRPLDSLGAGVTWERVAGSLVRAASRLLAGMGGLRVERRVIEERASSLFAEKYSALEWNVYGKTRRRHARGTPSVSSASPHGVGGSAR